MSQILRSLSFQLYPSQFQLVLYILQVQMKSLHPDKHIRDTICLFGGKYSNLMFLVNINLFQERLYIRYFRWVLWTGCERGKCPADKSWTWPWKKSWPVPFASWSSTKNRYHNNTRVEPAPKMGRCLRTCYRPRSLKRRRWVCWMTFNSWLITRMSAVEYRPPRKLFS